MEDNDIEIYAELPGYESSTIDTKNKTRKRVKELARSLANSNNPKDLLDYENGITKVIGNKARLFKRAYRKQDKQNKEYTAKLERDDAVIQAAKEGTLNPEQFGKWIATKRDESPITQKFVMPLIMGSAFGPAGAIAALSGESVNTGVKGASKGLYDTWGEWLTGGSKGWSIPAELTNPGYLIAGPLAVNKTGYTWRTGTGSTVKQNLQNTINQEIKDFIKGVKTVKLSDSVIDKNILVGKLGWSPSTTETLYHHSDKQLNELDPLFRSWDVTKRNAPLGKVWLTENPDIVELGGERPFHYQTTVRLNKPMVQLNEAIQPSGKDNARNQIISFAQESGADGIQFKNIADNKLLHQNQTAAFKPVELQSENVYELPIFAGGKVDISDPNIRQQIIKAFKQRNQDFVEGAPFEFIPGGTQLKATTVAKNAPKSVVKPISEAEKLGIPKSMRSNPKALEDPYYWGYQQWNSRYITAVNSGNIQEAQRLRDLHFKQKAPDTQMTGTYYRSERGEKPWYVFDIDRMGTNGTRMGKGIYFFNDAKAVKNYGNDVREFFINSKNLVEDVPGPKLFGYPNEFINKMKNNKVPSLRKAAEHVDGADTIHGIDVSWGKPLDEWAVKSPNQIKLADPITRTDTGEIIPIVKRDNFHNPDIRYKQGGILKGQNSIKVPESATSKAYFSGLKDYLLHQTKSFTPSQYKPTKGSNIQQQYYTRPGLKEEVVLNLFGGTDSNAKGPVGQNYFYKDFDDAYNKLSLANESRIASNGTLGNYGVSAGVDDKGRYISFIDIFDHVFIPGKGIPIYDRIYEDEIKSLYNPNLSALNEGDWITRSPILKRISKYKLNKGGIIKAQDGTFEGFWNTLPQNQQDSTDFNVRRYWELNGKPVNFKEAIKRGMYKKEKDGYHANSIAFNEETGEYEFMKSPNHPTIQYELDWFNSDKANKFRNKYQLDSTSIPWKYVPKGQTGMVLGSALLENLSRSDTVKNISENIRKWGTNLKNHINTINRYNPEQVPVIGQPGITTVRRAKIGPLVSARGKDPKIVENGGEV